MDFTKQGLTYLFLIIPVGFALVVLAQGIEKMSKGDAEGKVATGFGVFLVGLIVATYFLFIR